NPLGKSEIVLLQGLSLGQPCLSQSSLEGSLLAASRLQADQLSQHLEHRGRLASCLVKDPPIGPGNLQEFQLSQITVEPRLVIVFTSGHQKPPHDRCRNGRKVQDRRALT